MTGGGGGIGRALAGALVARGDTVVITGRNEDKIRVAAKDLGPNAAPAVVDVCDREAVAGVVADTVRRHGRLDLLLNNAGVSVSGETRGLSDEHWDTVLDTNIRGVVHGVQAAYPLMCDQGFGHIVNTASLAGLLPGPLLVPYATSKYAVIGLSLSLRPEAAIHGVRVSALCPGPIDTTILDSASPAGLDDPPQAINPRELLARLTFGQFYDPDDLAADALAGIAANKALIVAPWRARLVWRAARLSPAAAQLLGTATVRWARKHLIDSTPSAERPRVA